MSATLKTLKDRGFDLSKRLKRGHQVKCSQCQALVINGVPTHESGCPNSKSRRAYAVQW